MTNRELIAIEGLQSYGFVVQTIYNEKYGCTLCVHDAVAQQYSFYIRVASSTFTKTQEYVEYIHSLQNLNDINITDDEKPIILVLVNEKKSSIMFGVLLYWQYGHPFINPIPNFRSLNEPNTQWLKDVVKAAHRVIAWLKPSDFKVIKSIELNDKKYPDSYVVYMRDFGEGYKMAEKKHEENELSRLIYGTPQEEYPSDMLDRVILDMVRNTFPSAKCISSTLLFGLDIMKLQHYKSYEHYPTQINIIPAFFAPNASTLTPLQANALTLTIDVCYHNNFFERNRLSRPLMENEYTLLDVTSGEFQKCTALINTYHPLSEKWM